MSNTNSLKTAIESFEFIREEKLTILQVLVLTYVYLMNGKASQSEFAYRYGILQSQSSAVFRKLAFENKLIESSDFPALRKKKASEAFKFFKLTQLGKTTIEKILP